MAKNVYAVRGHQDEDTGERVTGGVLYTDWPSCQDVVAGTSRPYKGFYARDNALEWLDGSVFRTDIEPESHEGLIYYTDGSGSQATEKAAWAFAVFDNRSGDETLVEIAAGIVPFAVYGKANVVAEVMAAREALYDGQARRQPDGPGILIVHDYTGVAHFAEGEWDASTHPVVEGYHDLCTQPEYQDAVAGFWHVEGHTGVRGNEIADVAAWNARVLAEDDAAVHPKIST